MRRKIAFFFTCAATVLMMVLRLILAVNPSASLGFFGSSDFLIALSLVSIAVITALSISKQAKVAIPQDKWASIGGWISTFCGAVLAMSILVDIFCWTVYQQIPPPNDYILNQMDLTTLVFTLVFGLLGGVFLMLQGFYWMARSDSNTPLIKWLSLTPVLWMWFRLARYEISYASTIDISESFFDFAVLVITSLFFLQLARTLANIGTPPKNGLLIFSLSTALISLSGAPATIYELASGEPIGSMLIAVVDAVVGLFALCVAAIQVFAVSPDGEEQDAEERDNEECSDEIDEAPADESNLAWTTPVKEHPPVDPPFAIDQILPTSQDSTKATTADQPHNTDAASIARERQDSHADAIDELLSEIEQQSW